MNNNNLGVIMNYNLDEIKKARTLGINSTLTIWFNLPSENKTIKKLIKELRLLCRASGATFYRKANFFQIRNIPKTQTVTNPIDCILDEIQLNLSKEEVIKFETEFQVFND